MREGVFEYGGLCVCESVGLCAFVCARVRVRVHVRVRVRVDTHRNMSQI